MKKIILSLAMASVFIGVSAQKAEMQAAQNALKSKDYTTAMQQVKLADSKMGQDPSIKPEEWAEFYYAAAKGAKASGDVVAAGAYFAKLHDLESNVYYKAKNKDSKKWEYFYNEKEAHKVVASGNYSKLKESKLSHSLLTNDIPALNSEAGEALKAGNNAFKSKNYKVAGDEFLKAYYLYKAIGQDRPIFEYYAALGYVQSKDYEHAIHIFEELLVKKFTGVEKTFIATNEEGKDVSFASKDDMDVQVKLGLVSNPRTEVSESLEEDLYSNATYTYFQLENYDKALEVGQAGLKMYPKNDNMNKLVSAAFQKSGNIDDFISSLQAKVDEGTADAVDYFNLAKSLEDKDFDANYDTAKAYYAKAIALDPSFNNAYLNLAFLIISPEKEFVAKMNDNLGGSSKEKKIYEENKAKRKALYVEALPYLEKAYEGDSENPSLIKIMKNSYEIVGNDDKYMEFKKKYDNLVE